MHSATQFDDGATRGSFIDPPPFNAPAATSVVRSAPDRFQFSAVIDDADEDCTRAQYPHNCRQFGVSVSSGGSAVQQRV